MKRCVGCGLAIPQGTSRCTDCEREFQAKRNADPKRAAYADPAYRSYQRARSCAKCGSPLDLTRDHITAIQWNGSNNAANLQTLCRSCNGKKGAR